MAYDLQRSFSGGEITPKMHLRNDYAQGALYQQALALCRNCLPTPHGPAQSRQGLEFLEEIPGETFGRIFDLDVSFSSSFAIVVTDSTIYVLDKNGFTLDNDIVTNGNFNDGALGWSSTQVVFALSLASLEPTGGQSARLWQELTTPDGAVTHRIQINGSGSEAGGNPFTLLVGTAAGLGDILTVNDAGFQNTYDFIPGQLTFWIEVTVPINGLDKVLDSILVSPTVGAGDIVTFTSPYTEQDIRELQVDKEPGNKTMFFVTRGVAPYELNYSDDTGDAVWAWDLVVFDYGVDVTDAPWGGAHPGCITFYAGRMVLGGTNLDPVGIWLSKPRAYRNFDLGDTSAQVASDALYLPLDKHGELQWLEGNKQLFAGLDTGEHVIWGGGGVITGNNAETEQHSTYGSLRVQSVVINEEVAYVDTRGRKVRLMSFDSDKRNMISFDISFIAEHITFGNIIEMKFGSSPLGVLYMVTLSGDVITCHIEKDKGIYGWSRQDTQGTVLSVTLLKEEGLDVPWLLVLREGKMYVERWRPDVQFFADSALAVTEPAPTNIFFGFDHLIGMTCQVVLDDAVHPDVVVEPDGSVILDYPGLECKVGLGFLCEIETLPKMDDGKSGNTRAHMKRYSTVDVHLLNSARPIVNGQDTYRRSPSTPMDTREIYHTEIVEITNVGWDNDAIINVSQPLPLAMVIQGIGGKLKASKL